MIAFLSIALFPKNSEAFNIPESLKLDLTWTGIKAGEAVMEVKDNGDTVQLVSKANSANWVSKFYHVEDVVTSTLKKTDPKDSGINFIGLTSHYRIKVIEGKNRKDREMLFDQKGKKVTYTNHLEKEKLDFPLNNITFDALASFYYVRTLPLEVGKTIFVEVFDNKKLYSIEVQVLKKETIETDLGKFKTILIKPVMKSEGIFYRKGDILIWLTDDEKRLPVLVKTKVLIGSVKATLTGGKY
ncbi:MAG: DUF3108 domain-containing protein [Nitrospirae bacterium]|nr:DUF3108 domain-containing protein [Nitrospirota bacterium]